MRVTLNPDRAGRAFLWILAVACSLMVEGYLAQSISFLPDFTAEASLTPTILREAHVAIDQVARAIGDLLSLLGSLQ